MGFYEYFHRYRINGGWPFAYVWYAPPKCFGHASADRRWVGLLNLKKWIIQPVISVGIVLVAWIYPSGAAQLRDIRVGEYETHTRIVFELSDTTSVERIIPMNSGQLTVIFPNTGIDLIRKIPFDHSDRLKTLQIWHRQNELSLVLTFAFKQFRYERSKYDQPTRLVLDVFQLTSDKATSAPPATKEPAMPPEPGNHASASVEPAPGIAPQQQVDTPEQLLQSGEQVPSSRMDEPVTAQASQPISPDAAKHVRQPHTSAKPPALQPSEASTQAATVRTESLPPDRQSGPPQMSTPQPKRLQYYLVIGLIMLTLVILVLLLVMLVSKSHWANASSPIQPDEFLERQEERIAEIDAKIHEQLKRFDNG